METRELISNLKRLGNTLAPQSVTDGLFVTLTNYIEILGVDGNTQRLQGFKTLVDIEIEYYESELQEFSAEEIKEFDTLTYLLEIKRQIDVWLNNNTPASETENKSEFPDKKTKYTSHQYILTYLLDCHAQGKHPVPENVKKILEGIGRRISKGAISGNTFYKEYGKVGTKNDLNARSTLVKFGGENWREIVLALSDAPQLLDKYLKNKGL